MNKVFLGSLLVTSVLLIGCETTPGGSTEERPFGTIFDVPAEASIKVKIASVTQEDSQETDFSVNESVQEDDQVIQSPGEALDKKDLLYGFYNSGIIGTPADFDNFFDEVGSQSNNTKIASSTGAGPAVTASAFGTLFDFSADTPADFDNFFSNDSGAPVEFGDFFSSDFNVDSDFQFDPEKQAKIKIIKENTITTQKNNVIADQIRNEDVDTRLITDLANLEKDIPVKESELVQMMRDELKHKIRLLDAETALKVAEIKMFSSAKSDNVVARVEDRVSSKTSGVRKELIRKMFISEPENYYQLKEQGKQLDAIYQVDIAKVKLQYQQKIDVVKNDIESLRAANKKIIDNRYAELEAQRIAEALIIEGETKAKNQEIVDQSYPGFQTNISKYIDAFEIKLSQRESFFLDRLKEEYISKKSSRVSARELENRRYIANINQQIEQEQNTYEDQSRDRLNSARDAKVGSIIKGHKRSINRVESDGAQKIAALEARHAREHEKQKNILQAPYKKKERILNQKSQQSRSKVLSRFNSENYAIIAKEKKETDVINREINARVKAEIKALLGRFEALKKEEAAIAKKISLEKPKESPGFFESLF